MRRPGESIARRVRSQSGASLLIALMFVLVAGMIAAVVVSAAAVNAERVNPQRENEQAYLTVESALRSSDGFAKRDIDGLQVSIAGDGSATHIAPSVDRLGLAQWAADGIAALAQGGAAEEKNVIVTAQSLGAVDVSKVPRVLLTFSIRENGVFVRASQYVDDWDTEGIPGSEAALKSDLVNSAEYAYYLTKQVASMSGFKKGQPCTVTLSTMANAEADSE